jgi:hypothetical protein
MERFSLLRTRAVLAAAIGGLLAGLILAGVWPHTPLHAVATDRSEDCVIATGALDDEMEGVFVLDLLTSTLRAAALSRTTGRFVAQYEANLTPDFTFDTPRKPRFTMVTGVVPLPRGNTPLQPSRAVVYVGESTTGKIVAYYVPWSRQKPLSGKLVRLDAWPFRPVKVLRE